MRKESSFKRWPCVAFILMMSLLLTACSSGNKAKISRKEGRFSSAFYTVKRGDTLFKVSKMTGSSVGELARLNGISPPYMLQAGQRLRVKSGAVKNGVTKTASTRKNVTTRKTVMAKTNAPSRSSGSTVAKVAPPPPGSRCWLWPAKGQVIEPFSDSSGGNKGIDIAGTHGQPVYASAAGTVVYVGNQLRGYGNLVMIKHSEEYITAYAHNDTTLVNSSQTVVAGQKIATMGSSGSHRVNLHFQIRYRAKAVDPQRYLKSSC